VSGWNQEEDQGEGDPDGEAAHGVCSFFAVMVMCSAIDGTAAGAKNTPRYGQGFKG
jgi:hypothetical protein